MKAAHLEQQLKAQMARELCAILHGDGGASVDAHVSELSRLRRGDLRRFSLDRIVRYIARAGYDIEVHLKKTPRLENRRQALHPASSVVRYDYYGRVVESTGR